MTTADWRLDDGDVPTLHPSGDGTGLGMGDVAARLVGRMGLDGGAHPLDVSDLGRVDPAGAGTLLRSMANGADVELLPQRGSAQTDRPRAPCT
ncbi:MULTISPECIES: hypothetical protein [Sphingobium]|uniref:hypothetical protein n=1 Tax=Sphingobium TaxID=165695 RepID=UPI001C0ADC4E|nr:MULTISPECIES: hypothetical protein [Sphingobium]QWT14382.1 hypothetical protein GTV57_00870 [Sphingobium xenophagum]